MTKCTFLAWLCLTCAEVLAGERYCLGPGDLNADHIVNALDYSLFPGCLGGPALGPGIQCFPEIAMSADFDQDGAIDLLDAAEFLVSFGNSYFDYGPYRDDKEAEHLAIKLTGELRAPDYEYERIHRDLLLMSAALPELAHVKDWRKYGDRHLLVRLLDKNDGDKFGELNSFYVALSDHEYHSVSGLHLVTFCGVLDAVLLAELYEQLEQVDHAEPDHTYCTQSPCCQETIAIETDDSYVLRYHYSYTYPSPKYEGESCYCWRKRIIETNQPGDVSFVFCTDSCLPACP